MLVCQVGELSDVDDPQQRIGWGLDVEQPRLRSDLRGKGLYVAGIGVANRHAGAVEDSGEQAIGSTIQIVSGEDLVSYREQSRNRTDRRQTTGETKSAVGILQSRQEVLEHSAGWVSTARIIVAAKGVRFFLLESCGLVDRRGDWPERIFRTGIEGKKSASEFHEALPAAKHSSETPSC